MSASGFLYFLFLLLGSAPSSRTQGTSMVPNLDMMENNHSTSSEEPPASSLSTALSPTTSELQLTSRDPVKDGEGNLEPRTVTSRTNPQTSSISSDEYTLRKRGLIAAAVLFITGILILTSDRCRQFRWCRRQQRSAYRVSQA
ncbi:FXYD domain-containing ion transport regulator 5-like [Petaurus breviceps papuanus]|uniref:FXYD domain-containing ion transport regulator 5-like n=1 Tax=Petaurus breviceps papuanus TaxID=3040969 RepID=UPI0036DF4596